MRSEAAGSGRGRGGSCWSRCFCLCLRFCQCVSCSSLECADLRPQLFCECGRAGLSTVVSRSLGRFPESLSALPELPLPVERLLSEESDMCVAPLQRDGEARVRMPCEILLRHVLHRRRQIANHLACFGSCASIGLHHKWKQLILIDCRDGSIVASLGSCTSRCAASPDREAAKRRAIASICPTHKTHTQAGDSA